MKRIQAILFDLMGTTVLEKDADIINGCFETAFEQAGILLQRVQIQNIRGMNKADAVEKILRNTNRSPELRHQILHAFTRNVKTNLHNFYEHPELSKALVAIRKRGIFIGIASGLPQTLFELLYKKFDWDRHAFDFIGVYETCRKGRPDPEMIFRLCRHLNIPSNNVLKVGDTSADVEEGRNAGAVTAAILVGTQSPSVLVEANPDYLLKSLIDVIEILG